MQLLNKSSIHINHCHLILIFMSLFYITFLFEMISEITLKFTFRLNIPQILVIPLMIMILSIFSILVIVFWIHQNLSKQYQEMSADVQIFKIIPPLYSGYFTQVKDQLVSSIFFGSIFFLTYVMLRVNQYMVFKSNNHIAWSFLSFNKADPKYRKSFNFPIQF